MEKIIGIDYFDEDGDMAFANCYDRAEAIEKVKELKEMNLEIIGWYFTDGHQLELNKDWFDVSELILN